MPQTIAVGVSVPGTQEVGLKMVVHQHLKELLLVVGGCPVDKSMSFNLAYFQSAIVGPRLILEPT